MVAAAGILLMVAGVVFPMAILAWLSGRMSRQPALQPRQVGLLLALNGTFPVALITLGIGLLTGSLATNLFLKIVIGASAVVAASTAAGLWWTARRSRPGRKEV